MMLVAWSRQRSLSFPSPQVRLDMERARAEHSTRAEPVPEDYEDLDTEGLLNASGKALLRSMEIMGDMKLRPVLPWLKARDMDQVIAFRRS